ncbi:unnamed protein product [Prorocentrum cordatum]|uniref:Protein kinase domain-containing protein n=1 Tax=Prorocentrum cordatum TaxID=2364126 RepID=A0ABN9RD55_9DINO|nr:unnamed protein product [Polarella glacialis]
MSSRVLTWNSDNLSDKSKLTRTAPVQASDSQNTSDTEETHESFPVHGLGEDAGYESQCAFAAYGDTGDGDDQSEDLSLILTLPAGAMKRKSQSSKDVTHELAGTIQKVASNMPEGERAPKRLLLRPYGESETAVVKAKKLKDTIHALNEKESSTQVVVGDCVSDLGHLCEYIDADSDFVKHTPARILHREDTVDVRVMSSKRLGDVVQKTYLEQTMRWPFRCHSSMQDQLLYEASILKSLATTPGVIRLLGWCYPNFHIQEDRRLKSLVYKYIDGNLSPKQPVQIASYAKQLLYVLDHLHYQGIVHCNVKRENVLYDGKDLTLIDFETAVNEHELIDMGNVDYENEAQVYYRSNPYFSAPEVLEPQRGKNKHGTNILYGHRRDVWGGGVIIAELLLGMDEVTHLFPRGRRELRIQARREFCEKMCGGSVLSAFQALQSYGNIPLIKFYKHGADLVKHMTLWSRFRRCRAWEALQHSFFSVDPEDTTTEPSFETMRKSDNIFQGIGEDEPILVHREDEYLYHRRSPSPDFSWDAMAGEGVAALARRQGMGREMTPWDIYWYQKEGSDYLFSPMRFYG